MAKKTAKNPTKKKTAGKRPSAKRRLFIKILEENPGMSFKEAALKAGYSEKTAQNASHNVVNRCKDEIRAIHEKCGITDTMLAKKLKEGLNAKLVRVFSEKGKVYYSKQLDDFPTRKGYLEIAHKLRGDFIEKHEHDLKGVKTNVEFVIGGKIQDGGSKSERN
jgi:hypothetical protein